MWQLLPDLGPWAAAAGAYLDLLGGHTGGMGALVTNTDLPLRPSSPVSKADARAQVVTGGDSRQAEGLASTAAGSQLPPKSSHQQLDPGPRSADGNSSEEDCADHRPPESEQHGGQIVEADELAAAADKQGEDAAVEEGLTFNMLTRRGGIKVEARKGDLE